MYNDEKSNHHHHSIFQSLLASWYKDLTPAHNILKLWRIFNIVGTFERLFFKISNIVKFSFIDHSHKIELRVLREKSRQNFFWNVQVFFILYGLFLIFKCYITVVARYGWGMESLILSFTFLSCFFYGPFAPDWILVSRKLQVNPILSDIGKIPIFDYFKRRSLKIDFSLSKVASRAISLKSF